MASDESLKQREDCPDQTNLLHLVEEESLVIDGRADDAALSSAKTFPDLAEFPGEGREVDRSDLLLDQPEQKEFPLSHLDQQYLTEGLGSNPRLGVIFLTKKSSSSQLLMLIIGRNSKCWQF